MKIKKNIETKNEHRQINKNGLGKKWSQGHLENLGRPKKSIMGLLVGPWFRG